MGIRRSTKFVLLLIVSAFLFCLQYSNAEDKSSAELAPKGAALVVNGKRLVTFYDSVDGLSPDQRAERASLVLRNLSKERGFDLSSIKAQEGINGTDIISGFNRIATITAADAQYNGGNTRLVANDFILKSKYALMDRHEKVQASDLALGVTICVVGFFILVLSIAILCRISIFVCEKLQEFFQNRQVRLKIQEAELMSSASLSDLSLALVKIFQYSSIWSLVAIYIVSCLRLFRETSPIADSIIEGARAPLANITEAIVEYIPKFFAIIMIALIAYAIMAAARFVFNALRDGSIKFADFDPDWAEPTYRLTRFLIIFFAMVCASPYLPGWDTPAFKQLGLVFGVLLTFGSSSAISNVMAGVVLTYTNAFRLGDRIRFDEQLGDVVDKSLFVTKIRSPKGEIVSLPNSAIMGAKIINYSAESKIGRLVLHTSLSIGYETPWRKVHEVLLAAAAATENVLAEPPPFVLQKSLDDYYVTYEINVFTDQADKMLNTYSKLHANIQDQFFQAGLEIMSPHYLYIRDGKTPAIPPEYLPSDFVARAFETRVQS